MAKTVAIIGAGIGGLATGCYARMNGYEARIFESHTQPGGLCTAWKRKGYTIDGCIHWLTGSGPSNPFYRIWQELGALRDRPMHDREVFQRYHGNDGRCFSMYADPDRLERHMRELSPEDAAASAELCGYVRKFVRFNFPVTKAPELMGAMDGVKMMASMLPFLKHFPTVMGKSLGDYSKRFKDPLIRAAIANVNYDDSLPLASLVMTLAPMSRKSAGYPLGGSLEFARGIEKRFLDLGGTVSYGSAVDKILEEDGRATGVRLADGTEFCADYVVSAMDMRATLFSLLDGKRIDPVHQQLFDTMQVMAPAVQVSFGVKQDFSGEPDSVEAFELDPPVKIAGVPHRWFNFKHFSFDPSAAPKGRSVISCFFAADWEYWQKLEKNKAAYKREKDKIARFCLEQLECHYPKLGSRVEVTDVATPLTWARYTGNWKGTFMTWKLSGEFQQKHRFIPKTVPGLEGVYLASMWTTPPGGVPGAARAGRDVVQLICRKDGRRFETSVG